MKWSWKRGWATLVALGPGAVVAQDVVAVLVPGAGDDQQRLVGVGCGGVLGPLDVQLHADVVVGGVAAPRPHQQVQVAVAAGVRAYSTAQRRSSALACICTLTAGWTTWPLRPSAKMPSAWMVLVASTKVLQVSQ